MESVFKTPILLICFNRPTHTLRIWNEIKKQHPKYVFVFQDGAREGNEIDIEKCKDVRAIFEKQLDWDCELQTYFSDVNLGCGPGPVRGITWFFNNVEQGIIFEDDCLPSQTLFRFYEELLDNYKDNEYISLITGTNLKLRWKSKTKSYFFSTVGAATMGSWATWKRTWNLFDYDILAWKNEEVRHKIKTNLRSLKYYKYYSKFFDEFCCSKQTSVWDYQRYFSQVLNDSVSIVSTVNQMSNIGFGKESTHTLNPNDSLANLPIYNMEFPMKNSKFKIDKLFDNIIFYRYNYTKKKTLLMRLRLKTIECIFCR